MINTTDKQILTAAGKALLAQLNAEEKALVIDKMIFANVPNRPLFPQPDDVVPSNNIVHEKAVEQRGRLSVDSVIYSTTLASNEGPFDFNWTGTYCSEYGVLVTIDHHALTPKTADEPGVAGNTLVRSVVLEYKDIAAITNITVDASTWQYNATPRMKKMDSDTAQANIDQNGKDWFIDDGFQVTPQSTAFNIKAGAGYVSGNRVQLEFDRIVQVPSKPSFIYIDAHREGTSTGEQVMLFDFVVTAEEKDDYVDAQNVKHFVCKITQVLADGSVSDLRPEGASASKTWVDVNAAKTFDDVDQLKQSSYRYENKTVQLLGRYSVGDGGKAFFKMKCGQAPDDVDVIELDSQWYLKLIESEWVSVVTLGMSPSIDDNSPFFERVRGTQYKNLTMPAKTFRMSLFRPLNMHIRAAPGAKIELFNKGTPVMVSLQPNTIIEDLWIHSTESDLNWQRLAVESTHDVHFYRGKVSGFRHQAVAPNAWGAFFNKAKRCFFYDTEFDDNTQSDIAIVDGCEDVGLIRCFGTNDNLVVNFEPNGDDGSKNITIDGMKMSKLCLLVNTRTANPLESITIKNSHSKTLYYNGADVTFENSTFDDILPLESESKFAGEIQAVGSFGLGDNLLVDPHFVVLGSEVGNWKLGYSQLQKNVCYSLYKHSNFVGVQLNPFRNLAVTYVKSTHPIQVKASLTYYVHITGTVLSAVGDAHLADHIRLTWMNDMDVVVNEEYVRTFRHIAGEKHPVRSEGAFIRAPEGAISCHVTVSNSFYDSKVSPIFTALTFHELRRDTVKFNDVLDKYHSLSNHPRTVYQSTITSNSSNNQLPMLLNDVIAVDKQMFRCIDDTIVENGHWVGAFKEV